jgi:hypothetical protein
MGYATRLAGVALALGYGRGKKVWVDFRLAPAGNGVGPRGEGRKEKEEKEWAGE